MTSGAMRKGRPNSLAHTAINRISRCRGLAGRQETHITDNKHNRQRPEGWISWIALSTGLLFAGCAVAGLGAGLFVEPANRMLVVIFATSMFLQSTAAVLSLRLMRITGWRTAWGLITAAIVLMVLRRAVSFYGFVFPTVLPPPPVRFAPELVALLTSVLMVLGIARLAPQFLRAKENEQALRRSERRLRSFTDALPDMTFVVDVEGRYVDVVAPDEQLLAVSSKEIIGRTLSETLPESVAKPALAVVKQTAETRQSHDLAYCLDVPAGRRWFEGRTAVMPGSAGERPLVMFVARDITDRVAAEEAYRVLAEQSIQGIAILQHGRLAYVNAAAAGMLGWTVDELLNMPESGLLTIVDETERVAFEEWLDLAHTVAGVSPPEEFCMIRKDGRAILVEGLAAREEGQSEQNPGELALDVLHLEPLAPFGQQPS